MTKQIKNGSYRVRGACRSNLQNSDKPEIIVIGVGNEIRGDDGVGLMIAHQLKAANLPETRIEIKTGEATALIECWKSTDSVILIDAVTSSTCAPPGKIYRIDARRQIIPDRFLSPFTHRFGVELAFELARALDRLPRYFIIYGIEGKCFDFDSMLTPVVRKAAGRVKRMVIEEICGFSGYAFK